MRIEERKIYMFSELSEEAQARVLREYRYWEVEDSWWYECILDDAKQIGSLMGIEIKDFGFEIDGADYGAWFSGRYTYQKGASAAIRQHAPLDAELHRIVDGLREWQRKYFYKIGAVITERSRWFRMDIDVRNEEWSSWNGFTVDADTQEAVAELLRDFADWIYRRLDAEYAYLTSDAAIGESLEANELEFTADGERA